jgi:RimJ/RimL family protein N-acetyltransferase
MDRSPPTEIIALPVVLRSSRGDELSALSEAATASLEHLRPWMPWASVEPLEPGLSDFIRESVAKFRRGDGFNYAIWDDSTSLLVGGAGLLSRLGPGRIEIGYWVRVGWLRRGIATAAARALTSAAFGMPGIEEVRIHCDEANVASAGVPRRLGFKLLRTVEDHVGAPAETGRSMEWAITAGRWEPSRPWNR